MKPMKTIRVHAAVHGHEPVAETQSCDSKWELIKWPTRSFTPQCHCLPNPDPFNTRAWYSVEWLPGICRSLEWLAQQGVTRVMSALMWIRFKLSSTRKKNTVSLKNGWKSLTSGDNEAFWKVWLSCDQLKRFFTSSKDNHLSSILAVWWEHQAVRAFHPH